MKGQRGRRSGWVVLTVAGLTFISFRAWEQPPLASIQISEKLIGALDTPFQNKATIRDRIATCRQAIWVDPRGLPQRQMLVKIFWRLYNQRLVRAGGANRELLFALIATADCFNSSEHPSEVCLWSGLAEEELSRVSSDKGQSQRWLDMASEDAELFSRAIPELPNIRDSMGNLEYLEGRILLHQFRLTRDLEDLNKSLRHFWSSVADDPASMRNRFYLSLAESLAGQKSSSQKNAAKILSLPHSPGKELLEGPSEGYRRWALALKADKGLDAPY